MTDPSDPTGHGTHDPFGPYPTGATPAEYMWHEPGLRHVKNLPPAPPSLDVMTRSELAELREAYACLERKWRNTGRVIDVLLITTLALSIAVTVLMLQAW